MKKLICAKDVSEAHEQGKQTIFFDRNTIVTPSAKDMAEACHICLKEESCQQSESADDDFLQELTKDSFVAMLKALLAKETVCQQPFAYEKHKNGLKLIKGSSVKMDVFDVGNPKANVHVQEIVGKEEARMSVGFLEIDHSGFEWELDYEEVDYVIEGTLQVTIDGTTYTGNAGDVIFVPKNSKVTWASPNKAKMFYATYPAL